MFGKSKTVSAASGDGAVDGISIDDIPNMDDVLSKGAGAKSNKKLSVERIYQKKTQLEHILLRPDTYIGSVETVTQVVAVLATWNV
jgi:hypothetical protein